MRRVELTESASSPFTLIYREEVSVSDEGRFAIDPIEVANAKPIEKISGADPKHVLAHYLMAGEGMPVVVTDAQKTWKCANERKWTLDALAARLTGRERIVTLCSPHNPGGRLWTPAEIAELAAFCADHDLILLSDEVHMDLVFPGATFVPTALAAPDALDRLVVITAASKGFNTAGGETGLIIVRDPTLRERMTAVNMAYGGTPNRFGLMMIKAAFTGGADWSAAVRAYLARNFALWRDRIGALPGVRVMDMQATYLSWVDFTDTGMTPEETDRRIRQDARIAQSPGAQFGKGGENFHRFNLAMPRARLIEAIERLETAFGDLQ